MFGQLLDLDALVCILRLRTKVVKENSRTHPSIKTQNANTSWAHLRVRVSLHRHRLLLGLCRDVFYHLMFESSKV